jgi:SNF2 family DNA or RNA helicase
MGCKPEMQDAFRALVRDIGVRRTLDGVMPHIKRPVFVPIDVDLNKEQRRMYDAIRMDLKALDQAGTPLYAANVLTLLQRLRQICVATPEVVEDYYDPVLERRFQKVRLVEPSSKLDEVMRVLEGLQWDDEKKEPLVIFSNFKDPLELLKARLNKHNTFITENGFHDDMLYKYIHLDVKDSDVERYRKWHDEFPKLEHRVFMSTLQLGGESINLTPARHVIFLDRSWSPKDNAQGIGRIRRPGQEGQPVVIHINANNTTDQYIEQVNDIKQGWYNQIFGDE